MASRYVEFEAAIKPCDPMYLKSIPLDKKRTKRSVAVVEEFIKKDLIPRMKEVDSLFSILYSSIYYGGSYYDGLRITEATEFDLDLILKMPFRGNVMRLQLGNGSSIPYGFAKYYCKSSPTNMLTSMKMKVNERKLFLTFFEEDVLLPVKVRDWFRRVVDKAVKYYEGYPFYLWQDEVTIQRYNWRPYSPAATLKIKVADDLEVDIDLVPVFTCGEEMLVPKTHPGKEYQKVWRLSYPAMEREQLKYQSCAKKVIRQLKWVRDNFKDWDWVSSYYLKTAVMLEIEKDGGLWSDKQLGEKLEQILKNLQEFFKNGYLPSLHDYRLNLLHHIKRITLFNAQRRLSKFIPKGNEEIADKLYDLSQKSVFHHKAQSVVHRESRIIRQGYCKVSDGEVEDLLEEAFPYEHSENEINEDDDNEEEFFPHTFIYNEINEDDAGRGWCTLV